MSYVEYNWAVLTRDEIFNYLYKLYSTIVNQELEINSFHKIIRNYLKKQFPIKITKKFNSSVKFNYVYIGGTYYSDYDQENKKCIEVLFLYNPNFPYLKISSTKFKYLCTTIADTILHEIIHMRQHRRRKFKILPKYNSNAEKTEKRKEQGYLGCSDEIDAYAFNIACELYSKNNGRQSHIVKYLNKNLKKSRTKCDTWKMYLKAFDHDHNHAIIKRLKKKVIRYLPYAEIGKPYRNKYWIFR